MESHNSNKKAWNRSARRALRGLPPDHTLEISLRVELINVTAGILRRLALDWEEIYRLSPEQFEQLVADRIEAMGCQVQRIGRDNQKDGGVDIVFRTGGVWPVAGVAQVKHHRAADRKTGPQPLREMAGVLSSYPFHFGVVVTNTAFTADAKWFADNQRGFLRLRDGEDLKLWIKNEFIADQHRRPFPTEIELCPGNKLILPQFR